MSRGAQSDTRTLRLRALPLHPQSPRTHATKQHTVQLDSPPRPTAPPIPLHATRLTRRTDDADMPVARSLYVAVVGRRAKEWGGDAAASIRYLSKGGARARLSCLSLEQPQRKAVGRASDEGEGRDDVRDNLLSNSPTAYLHCFAWRGMAWHGMQGQGVASLCDTYYIHTCYMGDMSNHPRRTPLEAITWKLNVHF